MLLSYTSLPVANEGTADLTPLSAAQLAARTEPPVILFWMFPAVVSWRFSYNSTPCPYECVYSTDRERYAQSATVRVFHLPEINASVSSVLQRSCSFL